MIQFLLTKDSVRLERELIKHIASWVARALAFWATFVCSPKRIPAKILNSSLSQPLKFLLREILSVAAGSAEIRTHTQRRTKRAREEESWHSLMPHNAGCCCCTQENSKERLHYFRVSSRERRRRFSLRKFACAKLQRGNSLLAFWRAKHILIELACRRVRPVCLIKAVILYAAPLRGHGFDDWLNN